MSAAARAAAAAAEVAPVTAWLPSVRARVGQALCACAWPELARQVERHLEGPLPLPLVLPLASCAAAGGEPEAAVDAAAACALVGLAVRWLDDLADQDRPGDLWTEVGTGRAANLAAGALALGMRVAAGGRLPAAASAALAEGVVRIGAGQERDQAGGAHTADACLRLIRLKTGAAFALLTRSGALAAGRPGAAAADALGEYGEHLGMLLQALDDLDGAFHPTGLGDLALGKATLPVVYAVSFDHPARDELRAIVDGGEIAARAERVRAILEAVDARAFLAWAALEERKAALAALARLRPAATPTQHGGRRALERFADVLFCDLGALVPPLAA